MKSKYTTHLEISRSQDTMITHEMATSFINKTLLKKSYSVDFKINIWRYGYLSTNF